MKGNGPGTYVALDTSGIKGIWDHPTCCAAPGDGAAIVLCERDSRFHGEGRQGSRDPKSEGREMRHAETVLGSIHERGTQGLPLNDVYRQLYNPQLCLHAYGRISRNPGAMTPGVTGETADGMSLAKIEAILAALRHERSRWTPVRRVYIEKTHATKKRPLGVPPGSDKFLPEVIRQRLEADDEPQCRQHSHGFRPHRGCHTALREMYHRGVGTKWFIEGDIAAGFASLDHPVLVSILRENIPDHRFLRLIEPLLRAGYLEDWQDNATLSGSPQGAVVSPILSHISLTKLDHYVESTRVPQYTRGNRRRSNPTWARLGEASKKWRLAGLPTAARRMRRQRQAVPSLDPPDPHYRRLRSARSADDWLLGCSGPRHEAEESKRQIGTLLREHLTLELSDTKTLISHARTQAARCLGSEIGVRNNNRKLDGRGHRRMNGQIGLRVPRDVLQHKRARPLQQGKAIPRPALLNDAVCSIVVQYQQEYRGLVEYDRLAYNLHQLNRLKWTMARSLVQTLAHQLRSSVSEVYRRYQTTRQTDQGPRVGLQVTGERKEGKRPRGARWGGLSLSRHTKASLHDSPLRICGPRTELEVRLQADTCELCGAEEAVEVHHMRALKD